MASADAAAAALAAERAAVESQIKELQRQRAAETDILDSLKEQRTALESDVAGLQQTLRETLSELNTARGKLSELKAAQEARRAKVLEEVQNFVKTKMSELGEELEESLQSTESDLNRASEFIDVAAHAATGAKAMSEVFVEKASSVTTSWAKEIDSSCAQLSESTARAREVADQELEAARQAAESIDSQGQKVVQWGEHCDEVAGLVEVASGQVLELQTWLSELTPRWNASREAILHAKTRWVESTSVAAASLEDAKRWTEQTKEAHETLSIDQNQCREEAEEKVASWLGASLQYSEDQTALIAKTEHLKEKDTESGQLQLQAVSNLCLESADLLKFATTRAADASEIRRSTTRHLAEAPAQHDAICKAFGTGKASLESIDEQVSLAAIEGQRGATMLRDRYVEAASTLKSLVAVGAEAVEKTAKDIAVEVSTQRACSEAFSIKAAECWQKEKVASSLALETVQKAVTTANDNAEAARRVGSDRIQAELERGIRARTTVEAAIEAVSSIAVSTLGKSQAELRNGLASEPLAAFVESTAVTPPRPEAANCPKVEIIERPSDAELLAEFRKRPADVPSLREGHLQAIAGLRENQIVSTLTAKGSADAEFHKARQGNRVALADVSRQN